MTIMTVEVRGVGDAAAVAQQRLNAMRVNSARSQLAVSLNGMGELSPEAAQLLLSRYRQQGLRVPAAFLPPAAGSGEGTVVGSGDFISTYGIPIGAGVAGLAVGLVIAKLARRRKG